MKKISLVIGVLVLTLASCGEPGKADFDAFAIELCECMADTKADSELAALGLDPVSIDYSICIKNAEVDVKNDQMSIAIADKCLDLAGAHADYIEGL